MKAKQEQYEHIEQLVFQYQNGCSEAGLEIVRLFGYDPYTKELSKFIKKYYNLLKFGVINFKDKDTRHFISLYMKESDRPGMLPWYQYAHTKRAARIEVQKINNRLKHLSDDDIIHELVTILLSMAKEYKKKKKSVNFCGYVYSTYRKKVKYNFQYLFKDNLYTYRNDELIDTADEYSKIDAEHFQYNDLYFEREKDEVGINWITGRTASYPFDQLSTFERTILSLHDDKDYTYEEIGARMGYHRDTIWKKRKDIKKKLNEMIKNPPRD